MSAGCAVVMLRASWDLKLTSSQALRLREDVVDSADLLTVGEVADRSGFAASALRYYERVGLIDASRTSGGQRRYSRSQIDSLREERVI